jgi:hypothetical protein
MRVEKACEIARNAEPIEIPTCVVKFLLRDLEVPDDLL